MAEMQLVGFFIEKEEYGVNILRVQEIILKQAITPIPSAPVFMEGIISLRGSVIPIIDLRKRFGLPGKEDSERSRIIVINVSKKVLGVVVDEVSEVLHIDQEAVSPPPAIIINQGKDYIRGIGQLEERLIIVLELEKLFSASELSKLQSSMSKVSAKDLAESSEKQAKQATEAPKPEPLPEESEPEPEPEIPPSIAVLEESAATEKVPEVIEPQRRLDDPVKLTEPASQNNEKATPKKRGRPRKVLSEEELNKPKRPRGRPRKVLSEEERNKPKRPRGRPRKQD